MRVILLVLFAAAFITGCGFLPNDKEIPEATETETEPKPALKIMSTFPISNATNVFLDEQIFITLNREIDNTVANNSTIKVLDSDKNVIDGALTHLEKIFAFQPTYPFQPLKTYTVAIIVDLPDALGQAPKAAYRFSFTTEPLPVVAEGLLHYYRMNGNGQDTMGSNHLTGGGPTLTTDRFGKANRAYAFDGIDDALVSVGNIATTGNAPRSVTLWQKITARAQGQVILQFGANNTNQAFGLFLDTSDELNFFAWSNDFNTNIAIGNDWEHWAVVHDGTNLIFYKNGMQVANTTKTLNTTAGSLVIGARRDLAENTQGSIDEVRIYDRVLSAEEINAVYSDTRK